MNEIETREVVQLPRVTLNRDDVLALFASAEHQSDYLIGLYRMVYGDVWESIEKVNGWPAVSEATAKLLVGYCIKYDKANHPGVMAGGLWLNNGFSSSGGKVDRAWVVIPAPVTLKGGESVSV